MKRLSIRLILGLFGVAISGASFRLAAETPAADAPQAVLSFPGDRSAGKIATPTIGADVTSATWSDAQGEVQVPPGRKVLLRPNEEGLSWLANLDPRLIYEIGIYTRPGRSGPDRYFGTYFPMPEEAMAAMGRLKRIRRLDLSSTAVTDQQLKFLSGLAELSLLSVSDTRICGAGFRNVEGLDSLKTLYLSPAPINDEGMLAIAKYTTLERLSISFPQRLSISSSDVTDAGLEAVLGLQNLTDLQLDNSRITDSGLEGISKLTKLRHLSLNRSIGVTDRSIASFSKLPSLVQLDLHGCPITDQAIPEIGGLAALRFLGLTDTHVTPDGARKLKAMLPKVSVTYAPRHVAQTPNLPVQ